jgi:hypothetical protein
MGIPRQGGEFVAPGKNVSDMKAHVALQMLFSVNDARALYFVLTYITEPNLEH